MKKILTLLLFVFAGFFLSLNGEAAVSSVSDEAGLLADYEISSLNEEIAKVNPRFKGAMFVYTTNQSTGDIEAFSDNYLRDKVGNDNNGAVLVIDMGQRKFHVSTSGNMIDYITDNRLESMLDQIQSGMVDGNYHAAASSFVFLANQSISDGVPGGHYRVDRDTGKIIRYKVITALEAVIAFVAAAVLALIFFFVNLSKYQLKIGGYKYPFREKSALKLTNRSDHLTNSFVTTRRIPKNNGGGGGFKGGGGSTTHSSGGGSFGGGGRSF